MVEPWLVHFTPFLTASALTAVLWWNWRQLWKKVDDLDRRLVDHGERIAVMKAELSACREMHRDG